MVTKTKEIRRSERLHESLEAYIKRIINKHTEGMSKQDIGAHHGIVRDRVAFYIANHYDVNFQLIRYYHSPTNKEVDMVEQFIEDGIDYNTVREYYHQNGLLFKEMMHPPKLQNDHGCIMFDKQSKKFLRIEKDGIQLVDQGHASVVDKFISTELTKHVVEQLIFGHSYDMLIINVHDATLYHLAEFHPSA